MQISSFTKPSNSFMGNVLKLVTGTVVAQALSFLVMPIVTRLFDPEAFGILAVFLALTGIVGVVACLRYHLAIMLPESDGEAVNILGVSLLSVIVMTLLSTMIVWLAGEIVISLLHAPKLRNYLWLVPVAIFFYGILLALTYWNSRIKYFGRLSIANIIASLISQSTKLALGVTGFISGGVLIIASMLVSIVSTVILGGLIWRDDKKLFLNHIRWRSIIKGCVRYRKFPMIETWGALLNSISWQLPALMLSSFFSVSVVGFYALGLAAIKSPLEMIGKALSQVFYQKASEGKNSVGYNAEIVENLMDKLMLIGIIPTIVLSMIGGDLFIVVFGGQWFEAGIYSQILAPWLFFWFISAPLSTLFAVYERQGTDFLINLIIFITRIFSLYIGGIYQNIYLSLGLFSASGIFVYGLMAVLNIRFAKANGRRILFNFFKYCLYSLPIFFYLFLIKYILQFGTIVIFSSTLFIIPLYTIVFRNKIYSLSRQLNLPILPFRTK